MPFHMSIRMSLYISTHISTRMFMHMCVDISMRMSMHMSTRMSTRTTTKVRDVQRGKGSLWQVGSHRQTSYYNQYVHTVRQVIVTNVSSHSYYNQHVFRLVHYNEYVAVIVRLVIMTNMSSYQSSRTICRHRHTSYYKQYVDIVIVVIVSNPSTSS